MKIELPPTPPAHLSEAWPGQFSVFSYYAFTIDVPAPIFIVTTQKENGLANASLSAWGMPAGSGREPKFVLQVHDYTETKSLIERNGEFVVNYPTMSLAKKVLKAATHFPPEADEILACGLSHEPSAVVKPPRVAECFAHFECRLDWARPMETEHPSTTLVQASIVHAAIDKAVLDDDIRNTHALRKWILYLQESINPESGAATDGLFVTPGMTTAVSTQDLLD